MNELDSSSFDLIFDLTWAAGSGEGDSFVRRFNTKYFNSKPEDFIRDHFPDDSKWQLLDEPVSKKDYINAPLYDSEFENLSLKPYSSASGHDPLSSAKSFEA